LFNYERTHPEGAVAQQQLLNENGRSMQTEM